MKVPVGLLAVALILCAPPCRAAERPSGVETDHLDAYDDGGKPSLALLASPGSLLQGAWAAELDVALGDAAALSLEADVIGLRTTTAYGGAIGVPVFFERVRFHGLYLEPRILGSIAKGDSSATVGAGATLGWEETWRFGLSVKGGIGVLYETPLRSDTSSSLVMNIRPLVDAAVGWAF
jgi:hypothetical protein